MARDQRNMTATKALPNVRWRLLQLSTALILSVYYLNYGAGFSDGSSDSSNPVTQVIRAIALALFVGTLCPIRFRLEPVWALVALYALALISFVLGWGLAGQLNDALFVNTIIQLPILVALSSTQWRIDYPRWLRFIAVVLLLQACIDVYILVLGESLWLSQAFTGGVGNPSSFGLWCSILMAFCLLHPGAGRWGVSMGIGLAIAAIMTKSLLAIIAVAFVYMVWSLRSRRRAIFGLLAFALFAAGAGYALLGGEDEGDISFIEHKLSAAGALVGLVDYDVDSSASVSGRLEIHERTFGAVAETPVRLLFGHLRSQPYWPVDSQLLAYLGSFGVLILATFVALHVLWTLRARRVAAGDGGFCLVAMCLFGLIFATNRILDYFPVATLYFTCIALTNQSLPKTKSNRFRARNQEVIGGA
jgi:hypothetical protein